MCIPYFLPTGASPISRDLMELREMASNIMDAELMDDVATEFKRRGEEYHDKAVGMMVINLLLESCND